jgi:hypothetical protein
VAVVSGDSGVKVAATVTVTENNFAATLVTGDSGNKDSGDSGGCGGESGESDNNGDYRDSGAIQW